MSHQRESHILTIMNSSTYSATFETATVFPPDFFEEEVLKMHADEYSSVVTDLCNVALNRLLEIRLSWIEQRLNSAQSARMVEKGQKTCIEFSDLCKSLLIRLGSDLGFFDDIIRPHMKKLEDATNETRSLGLPSFNDDLAAITLEGVSADRIEWYYRPTRTATFDDLPTETALKIISLCTPSYIPGDVVSARTHGLTSSSFARLGLVSQAWSAMIPPLLYHTIVLYARPEYLNRLTFALRTHGPLVRTVIIDDVDVHTDVHIQNCRGYINECLNLAGSINRVECYGDYQIGLHTSPFSPQLYEIGSVTLQLPSHQSFDVTSILAMCAPTLEYLSISQWHPHQFHPPLDLDLRIPQCKSIDLPDGTIEEGHVAALLSLATSNGSSSLRSMSLLGMNFDVPCILRLLEINNVAAHLTTLRVRLPNHIQRSTTNDIPIQLLALCPSLTDFSYMSPTSMEIFQHLHPSILTLELGVVLPHWNLPAFPTSAPSITSIEPFISYVTSSRAVNLRSLSIMRQPCNALGYLGNARLDTQNRDQAMMAQAELDKNVAPDVQSTSDVSTLQTGSHRAYKDLSKVLAELREGTTKRIVPRRFEFTSKRPLAEVAQDCAALRAGTEIITPPRGRHSEHTVIPHAEWPPRTSIASATPSASAYGQASTTQRSAAFPPPVIVDDAMFGLVANPQGQGYPATLFQMIVQPYNRVYYENGVPMNILIDDDAIMMQQKQLPTQTAGGPFAQNIN
ncbi:hypothetical protein H0H87_012307 [Tephrocybe sp. NHM501043]|nr:hypothetical protein H0H87_012307 [Tephrocybe sp. NHM501043]